MAKQIGFSSVLCVRDIALGTPEITDVAYICTQVDFVNMGYGELKRWISFHQMTEWADCRSEAETVFWELLALDAFHYIRPDEPKPDLSNGWWMDEPDFTSLKVPPGYKDGIVTENLLDRFRDILSP